MKDTHATILRFRPLSLWSWRSSLSEITEEHSLRFYDIPVCVYVTSQITFFSLDLELDETFYCFMVIFISSTTQISVKYTVPGVLLTCAASAVQRDHFVSADACFTHGTHLSVRPGF